MIFQGLGYEASLRDGVQSRSLGKHHLQVSSLAWESHHPGIFQDKNEELLDFDLD